MLIELTVKNYRSFKSEQRLSLVASKDKSLAGSLIKLDSKTSVFSTVALMGANGSGKSNVLHALYLINNMLLGEASQLGKDDPLPYEPYAYSKEPTFLEIVYSYQGIRYCYGFSFDAHKVYQEYLYHWPNGREALIFARGEEGYEFRENVKEQSALALRTPDNRLYLSAANLWNLAQTQAALEFFSDGISFLLSLEMGMSKTLKALKDNAELKDRILIMMKAADLGITDLSVDEGLDGKVKITTTHSCLDDKGKIASFNLSLEQESLGVKKFFADIGALLECLDNGSVLVIDDLDDNRHHLLSKLFIDIFQDEKLNPNGAQLVFTSHDALLLDLKLLRRDQIYLIDKDEESQASSLRTLMSFSPRKGENVLKGYLEGSFGAIPYLGS